MASSFAGHELEDGDPLLAEPPQRKASSLRTYLVTASLALVVTGSAVVAATVRSRRLSVIASQHRHTEVIWASEEENVSSSSSTTAHFAGDEQPPASGDLARMLEQNGRFSFYQAPTPKIRSRSIQSLTQRSLVSPRSLTLVEEPTTTTTAAGKTTTTTRGPLLFCWSHVMLGDAEEELIRFQLDGRLGIFQCDYSAVISAKAVTLGQLDGVDVVTWANPSPVVDMGVRGVNGATTDSYLNTKTFIQAWDILVDSGHLWHYEFIVKVDPDTMFLPDVLRRHVLEYVGETVYFANCGKYGGKPLLYGALEVFSQAAMKAYAANKEECKRMDWQGWGEDYYMQECMDAMGVTSVLDSLQVADDRCLGSPCNDYLKVGFHPFKDVDSWKTCHQQADGELEVITDLVP